MRVRYTLQAQGDLDAIYTYLDERNPAAAQSVKDLIEQRIRTLGTFPLMAPVTDEAGVLELSIVEYHYKVYCELNGDEEVWDDTAAPPMLKDLHSCVCSRSVYVLPIARRSLPGSGSRMCGVVLRARIFRQRISR
jgi:plasmid stabilization system protein ParE